MNFKFYLFSLIILVSLSLSCAKKEPEQLEVVVFDDGYKTNEKGEVVFEDDAFLGSEPVSMTKEGSQEMTRTLSDTSKIIVMYDGFGNKTEIRTFNNDLRLRQVILRNFADGRKQVFVYGQNGMVNQVPAEMIDEVMNTPSSEIASAAGILEGKRRQTITRNFVGITSLPTRPQPNTNVQVASQTTDSAQTETREETPVKQTESPVETKTSTKIAGSLQNFIPRKNNVKSNE
jgi:hypothetical protein